MYLRQFTYAVFIVFLFLSGCASSGHKIDPNKVERIKIGVTTKDEMYTMFGSPLSQSYGPEGKLMMIWHYVYVGPFGMGMKQQNLAVLFDQNEKVEKFNLVDNADGGVRLGP